MNQGLARNIASRSKMFTNCPDCGQKVNLHELSLHIYRDHHRVASHDVLLPLIQEQPGLLSTEYALKLGWPVGKVSRVSKDMAKLNLIHKVRVGNRTHLFLGPDPNFSQQALQLVQAEKKVAKPAKKSASKKAAARKPAAKSMTKPIAESFDVVNVDGKRFVIEDGTLYELILRKA